MDQSMNCAIPAETAPPSRPWFENTYFCRRCDLEWVDAWDCMC